MQFWLFGVLVVALFVNLGQTTYATFEPIRGFTDVAYIYNTKKGMNSRRISQAPERNVYTRDADDQCISFCDVPFTTCTMIDFPIYPIGLNVTGSEDTVRKQIDVIPSGFVSADCIEALTEFGCARSYFSCSANEDGSLNKILPCRSVCQKVHSLCPSFVLNAQPKELDCSANNDDGSPRYADDNCYAMHSLADPTRQQCPGGAPIDLASVLANTTLSYEEVALVAALWSNLNGPNWQRRSKWPEGNPCNWTGITCGPNPANTSADTIISISLGDNNLQGTFPSTFGLGVMNLQTLDLTQNKITGTIPDSLGSITSLQYLDLGENQLSGTVPFALSKLVNLQYLSLGSAYVEPDALKRLTYTPKRSNSLTGPFDPTIFLPMTQLSTLNLGYNSFSGALPAEIGEMTSLVALDLMSNKFTSIDFSFEKLVNLQDFDVNRNAIMSPLPDNLPEGLLYLGFVANYFYGTIPQSWANLHSIEHMALLYNNLEGSVAPVLGLTQMHIIGLGYNKFQGEILNDICNFKNLSVLNTIGNNFTGTIPPCLGDLSELLLLDLASLNLEGTIPPELGNMASVALFTIDSSGISGTIPPELGNLKSVTQIYVSQMNLTGTLPPELGKLSGLTILSLYGSQLSGTIPEEYCSIPELTQLDLSSNLLTGTIPECITGLSDLSIVDLSSNAIGGTIPNEIGNLANLIELRLHNMALTGTVPNSLTNVGGLEILDISGNQIEQGFGQVMQAIHNLKNLTTLNLSNNKISGPLDYFMFFDPLYGNLYSKIIDLNLGNNTISGTLGNLLSVFPALSKVDVSNNRFTGPISAVPRTTTVLVATGNPGLTSGLRDRALPNFLKPTGTSVKANMNDTYSCLSFTGVSQNMIVEFDAKYFNNSFCQCDMGFYGEKNECRPCLEHGDCTTRRGMMIITSGFYPTPSVEDPQELIACPQASFTINPCNPDNSLTFECQPGHYDRLCSKCMPGYRRDGRKCAECNQATKVVTIVFSFIALVALYVYLLWPRDYITESGLLKNFLFYAQATSVVLEASAKWVDPVPIIKDIYTQANFSIGFFGFDCVSPGFTPDKEYLITMLLPILFAALTFIVYVLLMIAMVFLKGTSAIFDANTWKHRCYFAFLFVVNALYFPLISRIFSAFNCNEDPITHKSYLSELPYVECTFSNHQYRTMTILAIVFFIPYVIGIPVLFYYLMKYYQQLAVKDGRRKMRGDIVCGFFILCYKDELYWWEAVIFFRRVVFALLISLVSFTSPFLSLGIFILILLSILVNSWLSPFALKVTNLLDLVSFSIILLTFLSGILFSSPDFQRYATQLAVTVFVLNIFIISIYVIVYVTIIVNTRFPQIRNSAQQNKFFFLIQKWFDNLLEYSVHNARHMVKVLSHDSLASPSSRNLAHSTSLLILRSSSNPALTGSDSPSTSPSVSPTPSSDSVPPSHPYPAHPSAQYGSTPPSAYAVPTPPSSSAPLSSSYSPSPLPPSSPLSSTPPAPARSPATARKSFPAHAYSVADLNGVTIDVLNDTAATHISNMLDNNNNNNNENNNNNNNNIPNNSNTNNNYLHDHPPRNSVNLIIQPSNSRNSLNSHPLSSSPGNAGNPLANDKTK